MNSLLHRLVLGSSVPALFAAAQFGPAFAQDSGDIEQVVVSASRITIAGYSQPTPVTVIGAAQLQSDGYANLEDSLRAMPQLSDPQANFGANQAGGNGGIAGASIVNLRSLGSLRTLVLFDGQRVPSVSPFMGGGGAGGDINTLPPIIVQRVDVVTGGASASWGSDAVAGVVNLVTDRNFNGFKADLAASDSSDGLFRTFSGQAAWGGDIDGGRGHIEFAAKVQLDPDTVLLSQEKWFKDAFWVSNPAYAPGNGQPQLIVANNVGLAQTTQGGIINSSPAGTSAAANALRGIEFVGAGVPQVVNYGNVFQGTLSWGGSLNQSDYIVDQATIGNPSNVYTFYGYGRYKLTDTIVASVTLNYNYWTGKSESGGDSQTAVLIKSDNAYIPASVRAAMATGGISSFTLGTLNINNFNEGPNNSKNYWSQLGNALDLSLISNHRDTYRGVFQLDGTLGDDWSWSTYALHGETRNWVHMLDANSSNLLAAEDAVTVTSANVGKSGLALGSIACRQSLTGTLTVNPATTIAADPNCIPLNVFGVGVASQQAIGYIDGVSNGTTNYVYMHGETDVIEGSMQGTLPWALPAGKVAVAFGMNWRKEQGSQRAPAIAQFAGYSTSDGVTIADTQYNILEGFGEVDAPILKNNIVNSLDVTAAGRMTSYSTSGLVETWKLGAVSQVNDDIKLRTTWSVDIRAPNLNELFTPGAIGANTARDPKTQQTVSEQNFTAGNPNLVPEVAHTISGGVVLTPTFIPGLTLSADWFHINLVGAITSIPFTTVVTQCNPTLPSILHPGTNGNPNDPICSALVFGGPGGALSQVHVGFLNINSNTVSGLDLAANYTMDFWNGTLAWATTDSYTDEFTITTPGAAPNDEIGASGFNQPPGPKWKGTLSAIYKEGPYSFTVQSRWFGSLVAAQNGNTGNQATAATANLYDPAHFEIAAIAYLDLRANYKWNDNISFYGAVDNLLDIPPPLYPNTSNATGLGTAQFYNTNFVNYDLLGRVMRFGVRINY